MMYIVHTVYLYLYSTEYWLLNTLLHCVYHILRKLEKLHIIRPVSAPKAEKKYGV